MIYPKANKKYAGEYIRNIHAKLAPHFNADSLRKFLYPQDEIPHNGYIPTETDDTHANAAHINALFANPQDDSAQPDTV